VTSALDPRDSGHALVFEDDLGKYSELRNCFPGSRSTDYSISAAGLAARVKVETKKSQGGSLELARVE